VVLGIAAIIEGWTLAIALRAFRKAKGDKRSWQYIKETKDPSTFTIVLEDSAAMLGLVFAFIGIFVGHLMGNPYLDGVASIMIGALLMSVAGVLVIETRGLLLGEGVNAEQLADIRRRVETDPAVESSAEILTMYIGPTSLLINLGVIFKSEVVTDEMQNAIQRIEKDIKKAYPEAKSIYIETVSISRTK
jgi:divalent metal cation (Fe/Co/Zn/Cd) transporter